MPEPVLAAELQAPLCARDRPLLEARLTLPGVLVFGRIQDRTRAQMAVPDNSLGDNAIKVPTATQMTCVANLCDTGGPGADITSRGGFQTTPLAKRSAG